jgi:hypothetical protein
VSQSEIEVRHLATVDLMDAIERHYREKKHVRIERRPDAGSLRAGL